MQQIYACEQLLGWCRQYQTAGAADAEARGGGGGEAPAAFEGMVAMSKKADDDGGDVLSTSRTKSARPSKTPYNTVWNKLSCSMIRSRSRVCDAAGLRKQGRAVVWRFGTPTLHFTEACRARAGKKKAPRSARSSTDDGAKRAPAKLNYDMDTLALCAKLKVPVPKDLSDVETLVQTVSEKKAGTRRSRKGAGGRGAGGGGGGDRGGAVKRQVGQQQQRAWEERW